MFSSERKQPLNCDAASDARYAISLNFADKML